MNISKPINNFLSRTQPLQKRKALLAVVLVGGVGAALLVAALAAGSFGAFEVESGVVAGPATVVAVSGASGGSAVKFAAGATPTPAQACTTNVTTATFSAAVSSASAGQVLCLATGNYGTWNGTNKAITITAQSGAVVTMGLSFGSGDSSFTIDGLTIAGADLVGSGSTQPHDITIKNSAFTASLYIDGLSNANVMIDHDTFSNIDTNSTCTAEPARIHLAYSNATPSGVTIQNSLMDGGNTDGIQAGTGFTALNNEFRNIFEKSATDCSHTDAIQLLTATGAVIRGNYIHNTADGIVAYDGVDHVTIEDNVIDLVSGRYGIELYSDLSSIVRHNTLKYGTGCDYVPCGQIILDHKTANPAGTGTIVENNIASGVDTSNGSTAAVNRNNMLHSGASGSNFNGVPVYAGGSTPTSFKGFLLSAGSPGKGGASDGTDVGIY